ncbi:putative reverse transcriptase domain-containing protein [Tanacetum coccineum]
MELVFHISNYNVENQVKFATYTFHWLCSKWWKTSLMKDCYSRLLLMLLDWKGTIQEDETVKFAQRVKSRSLFHEESEKVKKYVGGLPDMIRGNVMSYQPKTMEKAIKFANDQMDQKVLTITERQAEQKRKLEFNAGNNQGHQQQNKRHNTERAYTIGPGEKREYTGSLPLCTKCNYHQKGPCAPRCNKWKKIGHLAHDCRSSGPNDNNNKRGNFGTTQNAVTCYESKVYVVEYMEQNSDSSSLRIPKVQFVGHVIDSQGIHVDPAKIESITDWAPPSLSSKEILFNFLGLVGYYQRFIDGFFKNWLSPPHTQPMTTHSEVKVTFEWGDKQEAAFQTLKHKLCSAPILALPQGAENFIVYCDASHKGLGAV